MARGISVTRRRTLGILSGTIVGTSLAGCLGNESSMPSILVSNWTTSAIDVELDVSRHPSGESIIDQDFTLQGEENRTFENLFDTEGEKRIEVTTDGQMEESTTWDSGPSDTSRALTIAIKEDNIEFTIGIK